MNADSSLDPVSFSKRLNELYDPKNNAIEFQVPYKGSLGSYAAEVFCDAPGRTNPVPRILEVVSAKLTSKSRDEPKDAALIISRVGVGQQAINQIIITSDSALQIFQKIIQEKSEVVEFGKCLNKFYNTSNIEYVEPYNGKLGSHAAEIFHQPFNDSSCAYKILNFIEDIKEPRTLTVKCADKPEGADVLTSSAGYRGGIIQIVFTNTESLDIFKTAMQKAAEEKAKKSSAYTFRAY
jgi:hypothetical protein